MPFSDNKEKGASQDLLGILEAYHSKFGSWISFLDKAVTKEAFGK